MSSQSTSQVTMTSLAQETFRNIVSFVLPAVGSERRIAASTHYSPTSTTSYETYSRHLSLMGHGYPLWIPEPNEHLHRNYRKQGVTIGDVIIFTENGALDFVFNICRPANDPINSNGVPEGFLPFTPKLTSLDKRRYQQYGEDSYLASKSILKKMDNISPSGVVFLSSASEGAILTMPQDAYSEDLARISGFDEYLAANLENWYEYVNEVRGWGVAMGKLHLVTGAHKSKAWGMATFSNRSDIEAAEVRLRFKSKEDPLYGTLYSWEYDGESDCPRAGPTREQKQNLHGQFPDDEPRSFENQCLFVRTVNSALRASKEVKKSQTDAIAAQNPANNLSNRGPLLGLRGSGFYGSGPTSSILQSTASSAYSNRSSGFFRRPQLPIVRNGPLPRDHPSEAINEFLLKERPKGRIVITHDYHWMSLLTEKDLVFPDKGELLNRLMRSYKISENDEGVISLESIHAAESLPVSTQTLHSTYSTYKSSIKHPRYRDNTPPLRQTPPSQPHSRTRTQYPEGFVPVLQSFQQHINLPMGQDTIPSSITPPARNHYGFGEDTYTPNRYQTPSSVQVYNLSNYDLIQTRADTEHRGRRYDSEDSISGRNPLVGVIDPHYSAPSRYIGVHARGSIEMQSNNPSSRRESIQQRAREYDSYVSNNTSRYITSSRRENTQRPGSEYDNYTNRNEHSARQQDERDGEIGYYASNNTSRYITSPRRENTQRPGSEYDNYTNRDNKHSAREQDGRDGEVGSIVTDEIPQYTASPRRDTMQQHARSQNMGRFDERPYIATEHALGRPYPSSRDGEVSYMAADEMSRYVASPRRDNTQQHTIRYDSNEDPYMASPRHDSEHHRSVGRAGDIVPTIFDPISGYPSPYPVTYPVTEHGYGSLYTSGRVEGGSSMTADRGVNEMSPYAYDGSVYPYRSPSIGYAVAGGSSAVVTDQGRAGPLMARSSSDSSARRDDGGTMPRFDFPRSGF